MEVRKVRSTLYLFLKMVIFLFLVNFEFNFKGGQDKTVKLWGYDDGQCYRYGYGHAGTITKVNDKKIMSQLAIAPNQKSIISVGADGAIIVWKIPEDVLETVKEMRKKFEQDLGQGFD